MTEQRRSHAGYAVFGLALAVVVAAAVVAAAFWLTGGRWYVVRTPSMGTAAPVGTLIATRPSTIRQLHVGEIIAFHPPTEPGETYTHRVVAVHGGEIYTRGDINGARDPWTLTGRDVVGRAVLVAPRVGWLVRALPLLAVGSLVIFALTGWWVSRQRRGPARLLGCSLLAAVVILLLHPLVGIDQLETTVGAHGRTSITVVNTGLLPLRVSPVAGHGHATPIDISTGQVGVSRLSGGPPGARYLLDPQIHLFRIGWTAMVLTWLAPLLWTLSIGFRPPYVARHETSLRSAVPA